MVKSVFTAFFAVSLAVFFMHSLITKSSVFADSKFYFSYTRSIVFDHDLRFGNEFFDFGLLDQQPEDGIIPNYYPPGVSIFWLPLYYVAFSITAIIKIIYPAINPSGYEIIFEYSCGITNILLGLSGIYLSYRSLLKYFTEKISLLTATVLFLGTNLFFYIAVEPINSHAASFFISSLFVYYFLNYNPLHHPKHPLTHPGLEPTEGEESPSSCRLELGSGSKMLKPAMPTGRQVQHDSNLIKVKVVQFYFILGLLAGIAGLIRTQDFLIVILPVIKVIIDFGHTLKKLVTCYLLLVTGFLLGFLPQMLLWKYFFNTFWYSPYFDTGFNLLKPQILHVLFNSQNGLFITTPMVAIAFLGLIFKIIKSINRKLNGKWKMENGKYLYFAFYFLLQLYLVSSWKAYTQGGSYSIRMIISTYPLLAFGLANVIEKVIGKFGERKTIYAIGGFAILNLLTILNYMLKY